MISYAQSTRTEEEEDQEEMKSNELEQHKLIRKAVGEDWKALF